MIVIKHAWKWELRIHCHGTHALLILLELNGETVQASYARKELSIKLFSLMRSLLRTPWTNILFQQEYIWKGQPIICDNYILKGTSERTSKNLKTTRICSPPPKQEGHLRCRHRDWKEEACSSPVPMRPINPTSTNCSPAQCYSFCSTTTDFLLQRAASEVVVLSRS